MTRDALLLVLASAALHPVRDLLMKRHSRPAAGYVAITATWVAIAGLHAVLSGVALTLPPGVWLLAVVSALCLSAYYFGTMAALRSGDLSVYYPIIRSSPLLIVLLTWLAGTRSYPASALLAIVMIVAGAFALQRQPGALVGNRRTAALALLAMAGSAGSLIADQMAMSSASPEPQAFLFWVYLSLTPVLYALTRAFTPRQPAGPVASAARSGPAADRLREIAASLVSYASYVLLLQAFVTGAGPAEASAVRQASIPLSVVLAAVFLGETRFLNRMGWSLLIAAGIALLALART